MSPDTFANVLILTGPTGSGKSRLALELAPRLNAEIVAMDSMTLYRGMDVGTAKPTLAERALVRHHLLDVLEPWESASTAWWLEQASGCVRDIQTRGRTALFVGGTSLYLKALLYGLFDGPPGDEQLRARLMEEAQRDGTAVLHSRLCAVDPASANRIHPNDIRRIIRALEVHELTGKPISAWQTQWRPTSPDPGVPPAPGEENRCVCMDLPREELYRRIDERVKQMFAAGLVEEVRALRRMARPLGREAAQALGYKEVFRFLDGEAALDEVIREVQMRSRNYAKRQLTAFRHIEACRMAAGQLTFTLWASRMKEAEG